MEIAAGDCSKDESLRKHCVKATKYDREGVERTSFDLDDMT